MSRRRPGQPGSTRAAQQLPADVADLIGAGALPPTGTKARLRFPATSRYMEGLVDGYCHIDGALHLRLARAERDETGAVRAIRRTVRWATVEACSWDVAPTRRDELHAVPAPAPRVRTLSDPPDDDVVSERLDRNPGCDGCGGGADDCSCDPGECVDCTPARIPSEAVPV